MSIFDDLQTRIRDTSEADARNRRKRDELHRRFGNPKTELSANDDKTPARAPEQPWLTAMATNPCTDYILPPSLCIYNTPTAEAHVRPFTLSYTEPSFTRTCSYLLSWHSLDLSNVAHSDSKSACTAIHALIN